MSLSQSDHDLLIQVTTTLASNAEAVRLAERNASNLLAERQGVINQRLDSIDERIDRWSRALEIHLSKNGQAIENLALITGRSHIPANTAWTGLGLAVATAVAAIGKLLGLW